MGSKTVFYQMESESSLDEVKDAAKRSFMLLGGTIMNIGDGFQISQGTNGVNFAFTATFDAFVNIRQSKPGSYEITANVNWKPNAVFWACLIIGFFVFGILWIIPILYLFIDPSSEYQQAMFTINNFL